MRADVLGVGFDPVTMEQALARVDELLRRGRAGYVVTPNAEIVFAAQSDAALREILNKADLVLPDGIGVVKAAAKLGRPVPERVPGVELAAALAARIADTGHSLYLLGGTPEASALAAQRLREQHPKLRLCGVTDGYQRDNAAVLQSINKAAPDVLMVCMGSPRQERWMAENLDKVGSAVMLGLGGTIDIFAGTAKRAPAFFRNHGLEWFYRIAGSPARWKRALALPRFMSAVSRQRRRESRV